jgi:predicted AAA+ superfamily ATPase
MYIDLLESGLYLELSRAPERLESMIGNNGENTWIIIDEIQRVPDLLNEVHRLIEKKPWRFALCGSSARKLRRGGTNLLGGRALTRHLETFSFAELGKIVDINFALEWGLLPSVQTDRDNAADILNAYVNTYIKSGKGG